MGYGSGIITIDTSHNLATIPKLFTGYQIPGEKMLIQVDGSMISGTLTFEHSIDGVTWVAMTTSDNSIRLDASVSQAGNSPQSYSIELTNKTPMKYLRPVLRTAGSGKLSKIRILYS
jgi:hypothetical protein